MFKAKFKEFLKKEIPAVEYGDQKVALMNRLADFERKRERGHLYFIPRVCMALLLALLFVNAYSFIQEVVFYFQNRGLAMSKFYMLPFLSWQFELKAMTVLGDNALTLFVNFALILMFNRRFLGLHRVYRMVRNQLVGMRNMLVKAPTTALAFIWPRRS